MMRFLEIIRKKNIFPKIISLLLAVILWAYLSSNSKGGELQFRVALAIENLPGNMAVSHLSNRFVTVLVNGRADLLKGVHSNNIKAVLDLRSPRLGAGQYPIQITRNEVPDSVDISLRQNSVEVFVETRASKTLKVAPVIVGSVANGFVIGPIMVKPDSIRITGPGSILGKFTRIDTLPISVAGAENDIIMDVNLKMEQLDWLELGINTVHIVIPVAQEGMFSNFTVPIEIKNGTKYETALADTSNTAIVHMRNHSAASITDDMDIGAVIYLNAANVEGLMKNKKKIIHNFPINAVYDKSRYDFEILFISPEEASVSVSVK